MPAKKINFKKVTAGTLIVGAPVGATLGIVYGTKDKVTERQEVPAVTFGDKYFDATIKTDSTYAPSHIFSPSGGYNLYASYTNLMASNDPEHYSNLIEQKTEKEGGGPTDPIFNGEINVTDVISVEDLNQKILDINKVLNDKADQVGDDTSATTSSEYSKRSLGLITMPIIKGGKRIIKVVAYQLKTDKAVEDASEDFVSSHLGIDMSDYSKSLTNYIGDLKKLAGNEGFNWNKTFIQAVLSKTIPDNYYFVNFGRTSKQASSVDEKNDIHAYKLKYYIEGGKRVPVKFRDSDGSEHFVISRSHYETGDTHKPIPPGKLIDGKLGFEEYTFDAKILDANGDYDFENQLFLSHEMIKANVIPQIESSLDWTRNKWFMKMTFNKVNSESIVSISSTLDDVRNPESVSFKTIEVPLSVLGKPNDENEKTDSLVSVDNLLKYDKKFNNSLAGTQTVKNGNTDVEIEYEKNAELRRAVTKTINALDAPTPLEKRNNLYELIRDIFLGKSGSNMDPQFTHYLKRNLISDGLKIIGQFMPGILAPINGFESLIKMIGEQKASLVKYSYKGKEYQGNSFLRNVVFSDDNIEKIFSAMDMPNGTTNGVAFIYHSLIEFGIAEQRVPGIVSKGTTNENGESYILKSSEDWMWASVTKLTELSASDYYGKYSLYNLYSLFAGLNIFDPILIKTMESYGIKQTSSVDNGDSIISQLFSWANDNKVLPKGFTLQDVLADVPGTIKKLVGNLYKNNILARDDEAKGLPYEDRHKFVSFPKTIIEKVITLIPGVDWSQIKDNEIKGYKDDFNSFVKIASSQKNVRELSGAALEEFATKEWEILNKIGRDEALKYKLPSVDMNLLDTGAEKEKLYDFITGFERKDYLQKFTMGESYELAATVRDMFKIYDQTVLKGYIIPDEVPEVNPEEDVRKAAVSILGDPYTLISLIDSVKGDMDIDVFLDRLLPSSSIDINKMIPVLLETLLSKHNLDILSIDKILNVVSRMNLLPSIVDKILTPSSISMISGLIESGGAKDIFDALTVVYGKGLYTYLKNDPTTNPSGKEAFKKDLEPVMKAFAEKLKLLTQAQKDVLSPEEQKTAVTTDEFLDAIYTILRNGIGSSTTDITDQLKLLGSVVTNALELPDTMINVPKLVEAITDVLESKSIKQVLQESLAADPKNPTAFSYLFEMLHSDGSTVIYDMLPGQLKSAMDTTPTNTLMQITNYLINGFKTQPQFEEFLNLLKGILPKGDDGKTVLDKKITEIDPDITSLASVVPKIETLLLNAYNDKNLVDILGNKGGKDEISDILSPILKNGLLSDPAAVTKAVHDLVHAKVVIKGWFGIHLYTLDIWSLLPNNLKDTINKVLDKLQGGLEVVQKIMDHPINTLTSDDVKKVLDIVKIFIPNLNISEDLVDGILFIAHNGLNVGVGAKTPMDALKEVNKLFAVVGSFTTIPDMVKTPIMNLLIGKTTFDTYKAQVVTEMSSVIDDPDNQFTQFKVGSTEIQEITDEINKYNVLLNSLETYAAMVKDTESMKAIDVQTIISYKAKVDDIISQLKVLKAKIESQRISQTTATKSITLLETEIDGLKSVELPDVLTTNAGMLTQTYKSIDGKDHAFSELNNIERKLWEGLFVKAEAIEHSNHKTLDELIKASKDLHAIKDEIVRMNKVVAGFNGGVANSQKIFDAFNVWLKGHNSDQGSYIAPHKSNTLYESIVAILEARMNALKKTVTIDNAANKQDDIKAAYSAFNAKLTADNSKTDPEAINSIFGELHADDLKTLLVNTDKIAGSLVANLNANNMHLLLNSADANIINSLLSSLSNDQVKDLFAKLDKDELKIIYQRVNAANAARIIKFIKVTTKANGIDGLPESFTEISGKTLDWILDNVRVGRKSGWFTTYVMFDFLNHNTGSYNDSDVKSAKWAPVRTWSDSGKNIMNVDGHDGWTSYWKNTLVLNPGNIKSYKNLGGSHHIIDFLQHVYTKDLKWLSDNGWI